jgi:hypothetical protein
LPIDDSLLDSYLGVRPSNYIVKDVSSVIFTSFLSGPFGKILVYRGSLSTGSLRFFANLKQKNHRLGMITKSSKKAPEKLHIAQAAL